MTNKIAIVTGGSRGIGRNTVESLARRGVDSIFTYHSHDKDAETVVAEVGAVGAKAVALRLDTGKIASFAKPFRYLLSRERRAALRH